MKKQALALILALFFLLTISPTYGQEINEDFIRQHLSTTKYDIDPEAEAVVLYEKGTTEIVEGTSNYQIRFHQYRLVKILKPSAFELANIEYQYQKSASYNAYVGKTDGATYNLENGKMVKTSIEKSAVYNRKINDWWFELKYALPAVKEGSIIEYSYETYSDLSATMPEWYFQDEHPALQSEYELIYPFRYAFTYITQGMPHMQEYSNRKDAVKDNSVCYKVVDNRYNEKMGSILWGRKNIPAIKTEPFISSISNHIQRIDVQMSSFADYSSVTGKTAVMNNWKKFTSDLLEWDNFGTFINKRASVIKPVVADLIKNKSTSLEKAKAIFNYVRSNFTCTDSIALSTSNKLSAVFTNKQGNAAELNLLLVSMLKNAELDAAPLVLSTLGHIKADDMYPLATRFNNTVCVVTIEGKKYLLDASNKYNSFGMLPIYCYNGYARIIDKDNGDSITISSDNIKEKCIKKVSISNLSDTALDVMVTEIPGMFNSRSIRKWLDENKDNEEKYIENVLQNMSGKFKLSGFKITAQNNADTNIVIEYMLHQKFEKPINILYLNSDFIKYFNESPFVSMKRRLPVELPFQMDYIYSLNLKLPDNYQPDGLPEPAVITYEQNQLSFRHMVGYDKDVHLLTVTSRFNANSTFFPVAGYDVIRQFFEKMIYETNQVITLKKL